MPPPLIANTSLGAVRGDLLGSGVVQWQGLRFASAPRWAPPVPWAEPYAEAPAVFDANAPGPNCPQFPGQIYDPNRTAEECLYIQGLWAPANANASRPAPVMVWIYGGGFAYGGGDSYNGSALAASQGVVVVTVNYRLGLLGFLALQDDVDAGRTTGNWGLLDQQAALKWVAKEVGTFGGDAARVTLFGQSAGGDSVSKHVVMPGSRGLFHGAVMQSGATPGGAWSLQYALRKTDAVAAALGCTGGPARAVRACLARANASVLLAVQVPARIWVPPAHGCPPTGRGFDSRGAR